MATTATPNLSNSAEVDNYFSDPEKFAAFLAKRSAEKTTNNNNGNNNE